MIKIKKILLYFDKFIIQFNKFEFQGLSNRTVDLDPAVS
jgi:hypothetical protein